ncbi:helix-turn-helix domain-containing protein [Amycolatopsis sp. H20-H5]|uniref:helix-turn-helix domain-containing protein n=1 Tax=Amycolatopsis sp. H20-H5 TaxID=3046309 RepID=UPI002DBB5142|nr:helix-turn-helix transcriptional regulator [Amycolatopsis sp. H20-H5]MEC3982613.1 helix-turn-helix transcriptional regulator [Amycolatopsis sp. H20-H5]
MAESFVPSVRLRRIARVLRDWREPTGLSSGEVAAKAGWSATKQSRLENAKIPITPVDVLTLALTYDIPEAERTQAFNAVQAAQAPQWWDEVTQGGLLDDIRDYVELEAESTTARIFKIDLIAGLMQTTDYATALVRGYDPSVSEQVLQSRVDARVKRQARLRGDDPIRLEAIVAEGALHIQVGGREVMREQLRHLIDLTALPNVDLRVLPAAGGAHPAMGVSFALLSFADGEPDVGHIELQERSVYLEEASDVVPYRRTFDSLRELVLDPEESVKLIAEVGNLKR